MTQINPASIEWLVLRTQGEDIPAAGFEQDGDRLSLTDAQARQQQLGAPWVIVHFHTMVPPKDHQRWLNGAGARWTP